MLHGRDAREKNTSEEKFIFYKARRAAVAAAPWCGAWNLRLAISVNLVDTIFRCDYSCACSVRVISARFCSGGRRTLPSVSVHKVTVSFSKRTPKVFSVFYFECRARCSFSMWIHCLCAKPCVIYFCFISDELTPSPFCFLIYFFAQYSD